MHVEYLSEQPRRQAPTTPFISPGGLQSFTSESEHVFFISEEGQSHLFILYKREERRLEREEEKREKQEEERRAM